MAQLIATIADHPLAWVLFISSVAVAAIAVLSGVDITIHHKKED